MGIINFLFFLAIGRLIIWLLQINGLLKPFWALHELLAELGECDLCLGFWVYLGLSFTFENQLPELPWLISNIALAAIASFMVHLIRLGWGVKFGIVIYD